MGEPFADQYELNQGLYYLAVAEDHMERLRSKYDMDGKNNCCDLDVALSSVVGRILGAKKELNELLSKYPGGKIPLNWRR